MPGRKDLPPAPTAMLDQLIELARLFGKDPDFSRGGGGNASAKADGVLYIKPSGVPLATLAADDLVPLDVEPLLALLHGDDGKDGGTELVMSVARVARLAAAGGRRPSVELLFHALIPERFVLHTHPVRINAITCASDGAAIALRWFGDRVIWVPYTDPGLPLARAIARARLDFTNRTGLPAPAVTLMQNHGLIVAGNTTAEIEAISSWLDSVVEAALNKSLPSESTDGPAIEPSPRLDPAWVRDIVAVVGPTLRGRLAPGDNLKVVTYDPSDRLASFAASVDGRRFIEGGPMTPDQIVYAGSWPLIIDLPEALPSDDVPGILKARLDEHCSARGTLPTIVVIPGLGLFAAGDTWAQADTARHIFLDAVRVGAGALQLGGVRALANAERQFIETWEAESYRREVFAGTTLAGRFQARVALVTGAAQGFGLAIAEDLVAEGGHVVLADLNSELAARNARDLEERFGPGRATALAMNVNDEQSVAAGLQATVERYGGLDLLVSNAGVLRAGSVTGQPLADFDLVTSVNYRGYFLAVRFTAPILAHQHRAKPSYLGDIIEINSKSGLIGSSRNSAYAGSKFGGIGLTQSFALELVDQGIKVNAICPGNFLDGPLWSDPDNGLFVQYLREGKVPGATTIDDVRQFYEAKVPMGRGCTPADVLRAIYYLVEQRYETGQALPVTGGQVMLS